MPLYLHLFHGRADPTEVLSEWGVNGPSIGPFDALHVVYLSAIELHRDELELTLQVHDGLVCFDGVFYGDYEVLTEPVGTPLSLEHADRVQVAREAPSLLDQCAPLSHVFLDAVRAEYGAELARRLETLLRTSAA
jgi:hypothetical protein